TEMKRLIAVTAVVVMLGAANSGVAGSRVGHAPAATSRIAIVELGNAHPTTGSGVFTFNGRFKLLIDNVAKDTGTTVISPHVGAQKVVGGQTVAPVSGYDNLTSKQGTLSIAFRGVTITVAPLAGSDSFYNEYGTWKINGGSGIYKGWKGGGRWALVGT